FPAHSLPLPYSVGPPSQVVVRIRTSVTVIIIGFVHAHLNEASGGTKNTSQVSPAHHTVGGPIPFQQRHDPVVGPARRPELVRHPLARRRGGNEAVERGVVVCDSGGELDQAPALSAGR